MLWPRFVLGRSWHELGERRDDDNGLRGKYE